MTRGGRGKRDPGNKVENNVVDRTRDALKEVAVIVMETKVPRN